MLSELMFCQPAAETGVAVFPFVWLVLVSLIQIVFNHCLQPQEVCAPSAVLGIVRVIISSHTPGGIHGSLVPQVNVTDTDLTNSKNDYIYLLTWLSRRLRHTPTFTFSTLPFPPP